MQVNPSYCYKTVDEAFDKIVNGDHSVTLYDYSEKKLNEMLKELYKRIKEYNSKIDDVNNQILPSYPYRWHGIDGCLGVYCAEVTGGTFEHNAEVLSLFTGWNYTVLTDTTARKPLNSKALTSLAILGGMLR